MYDNSAYEIIPEAEVPHAVLWVTPPTNQGQIVEVSYSTAGGSLAAGWGDAYMRQLDHSDNSVTYYRHEAAPAWRRPMTRSEAYQLYMAGEMTTDEWGWHLDHTSEATGMPIVLRSGR